MSGEPVDADDAARFAEALRTTVNSGLAEYQINRARAIWEPTQLSKGVIPKKVLAAVKSRPGDDAVTYLRKIERAVEETGAASAQAKRLNQWLREARQVTSPNDLQRYVRALDRDRASAASDRDRLRVEANEADAAYRADFGPEGASRMIGGISVAAQRASRVRSEYQDAVKRVQDIDAELRRVAGVRSLIGVPPKFRALAEAARDTPTPETDRADGTSINGMEGDLQAAIGGAQQGAETNPEPSKIDGPAVAADLNTEKDQALKARAYQGVSMRPEGKVRLDVEVT